MKTVSSLLAVASVLVASTLAAANEPVRLADGTSHEGDLSTRNSAVRLGHDVQLSGDIDTRNGSISVGDRSAAGQISSRNGSITLGTDGRFGDINTRNGSITLGDRSHAGRIETRNGRIRLGEAVETGVLASRNGSIGIGPGSRISGAVETRNGSVSVDSGVRIEGDLESRNGGIRVGKGGDIAGLLSTRNGNIELIDSHVDQGVHSRGGDITIHGDSHIGGDVTITLTSDQAGQRGGWLWFGGTRIYPEAGNIDLRDATRVDGDIEVRLPEDYETDVPSVRIGPGASVHGDLRIDERVELIVEGEVGGRIQRVSP